MTTNDGYATASGEQKCKECGALFLPTNGAQRYCCRECRNIAYERKRKADMQELRKAAGR